MNSSSNINELISDIKNNSESYLTKITCLENMENKSKSLLNKISKIQDQIQQENDFALEYPAKLGSSKRLLDDSIKKYNKSIEDLMEIAKINTNLAISNDKEPLITCISELKGKTPKLQEIRNKMLLCDLKKRILIKAEELYNLRKRVFCISDDDNNLNLFKVNSNLELINNENIENIDLDFNCSNNIMAIENISNLFSNMVNLDNDHDNLEYFPLLNNEFFVNDKYESTKEIEDKIILELKKWDSNETIDDVITKLENEVFYFLTERQNKLSEILKLYTQKYSNFVNPNCISSFKTIMKSQVQLYKTQQILTTLSNILSDDDVNIWEQENLINLTIIDLISLLQQLFEKIKQNLIIEKIPEIKVPEIEPFIIEKDSNVQINRCMELISSLETSFNDSIKLHSIMINELNENLSLFNHFDHNDINEIDLSTPENFCIDDTLERKRFLELKQKVIQKQNEQLKDLRESLIDFPDSISTINITKPDDNDDDERSIKRIIKEDKKDEEFTPLVFQSSGLQTTNSLFVESNLNLIEKINQKKPIDLEKKKVVDIPKNIKITNTVEELLNKIKQDLSKSNIDTDKSYEELLQTRNNLINKINDLNNKIENSQLQRKLNLQKQNIHKAELINKLNEIQNQADKMVQDNVHIEAEIKELQNQKAQLENEYQKRQEYQNLINELNSLIIEKEQFKKEVEEEDRKCAESNL